MTKLINKSNNTIISQDLKKAVTFFDKTLGLLNKSNPRFIMFQTRFGIHTFFLNKPIDVIVLDRDFKVVKVAQTLKPNKLFFWNPRYSYIIELPQGTIIKTNTQTGDILEVTLA